MGCGNLHPFQPFYPRMTWVGTASQDQSKGSWEIALNEQVPPQHQGRHLGRQLEMRIRPDKVFREDFHKAYVAPTLVWLPQILASFPTEDVAGFGSQAPMSRAAQPSEITPGHLFLGSRDAFYITGQVIHLNGGYIVNR